MSFALFRTPSRKPAARFGGSGQDLTRCDRRVPYRTGGKSAVSGSMDSLLFSQDALAEWFPGTSRIQRTEELQCVFIPDDSFLNELINCRQTKGSQQCRCSEKNVGSLAQRGVARSKSFHVSRKVEINNVCEAKRPISAATSKRPLLQMSNCKTQSQNSNVSGGHVKRSTSMYAQAETPPCCVHGTQARASSAQRPDVACALSNDESSTNDIQLRRCLSLYDRAKTQKHGTRRSSDTPECTPCPPKNGHMKLKVYPTTKGTTTTSKSPDSPGKRSVSGSVPPKSTSTSSRPSSRASVTSGHSSSDLDHRSTSGSVGINCSKRVQKTSGVGSATGNHCKPSSIPRPARVGVWSPDFRARSNSVEGPNRISELKQARNSFVTRSVPSTPNVLETKGGFFTPRRILDSDSSSTDTLNGTNSPVLNGSQLVIGDDEAGYPEPKPSLRSKHEIYTLKDFRHVDERAQKAPRSLQESFDELLFYLLEDLTTDLTKVRAVFMWLASQKLPISAVTSGLDTPQEYLFAIRQRRATYADLFATLCRKAGVPCVIVYGVAKSVTYEVGEKVSNRKGRTSWNAVYVGGEWRLVHAYWAANVTTGYSTGRWALADSDVTRRTNDDRILTSKTAGGKTNMSDYYFLTDPDKFVIKCFPDDPTWQLLKKPMSREEFETQLFTQPAFHELKLKDLMHDTCVVTSENGKATFEFLVDMPQDRVKHYQFGYKLFSRRDPDAEGEYDVMTFERYCLSYKHENKAFLQIRFPTIGVYKLEVHCNDLRRQLPSSWVCGYKVICKEVNPECQPLPIIPDIGWGPGEALEDTGLECLTHSHPVVNLDNEINTFIRFALPKDSKLELDADLVTNNISREAMKSHLTMEHADGHLMVQITPPGEGEYALQMYVVEESGRRNVINYLLQRTKVVEDPELADIRNELIKATETGDVDSLAHWIDRFTERHMHDNGDLQKAKRKLLVAKLNRDIQEAMARKDLDLLERALHSASSTSLRRQLGSLMVQAEALRSRLRRFKRLKHEVLAMDQKTISEIRSYPKPPPAVHAVMMATFLLLGNKEKDLQDWSRIQSLISKRGKESLKRRVADFSAGSVTPEVLTRVLNVLSKYDLETVQMASVGAATFYQWAFSMSGESEEHTQPN